MPDISEMDSIAESINIVFVSFSESTIVALQSEAEERLKTAVWKLFEHNSVALDYWNWNVEEAQIHPKQESRCFEMSTRLSFDGNVREFILAN